MVAKLGSFSAAAEDLGISRAMASKHINHLETLLDVRLLNRTTRHLSLTEVGEAYRERVNTIIAEVEETELAITQLHSEPRGTLKIMAPSSFGSFHLARELNAYNELYPDVVIDMTLTNRTPDLIEEGMDLAIYVGHLDDSSLIARKLTSARKVVCGAPEYLEKNGTPEYPSDLKQHNCLVFSVHATFVEWNFMIDTKESTIQVAGNFKSNIGDAVRIAAINGGGLVQLPTYMVGLDIKSGRLVPVLENFEPPAIPIYALYIHRKHLSTKVRTFVDFIYERFQPTPYWDKWMKE